MRLYELAEQYKSLQNLIDDGIDPQAVIDTLEGIQGAIEIKAANIGLMLKQMDSDAEAIKAEEKRLAERRKSLENNHARVKQYLQEQLGIAKMDKIKTPTISIWIQNNPQSVNVITEDAIPKQYRIPQPDKIDKESILKDLKAGKEVLGCEIQQTQGIRFR